VPGGIDPEVVPTDELAPLLRRWRERYDLEHDVEHDKGDAVNRDRASPFGPIQLLAFETGLNPRAIYRIMEEQTEFTWLSKAEKLLMAIDKLYLLANGEINILPHPNFSFKRWIDYMLAASVDEATATSTLSH
jgi:hypothetical protein